MKKIVLLVLFLVSISLVANAFEVSVVAEESSDAGEDTGSEMKEEVLVEVEINDSDAEEEVMIVISGEENSGQENAEEEVQELSNDESMEEAQGQHEEIEGSIITDEKVVLKYRQPAKLFGVFNLHYVMELEADFKGNVRVSAPWWVRFSKNNVQQTGRELEERLDSFDGELSGEIILELMIDAADTGRDAEQP